jgi:ATP-dependent helicase/nuclease subunit B
MARGVVNFETQRREQRPRLHVEQKGELTLSTRAGPFRLTARADRIEVRDDGIDILDFKTGQLPSAKAVSAGFYPQLTLTAAIARGGGFAALPERDLGELIYVQVKPDETRARQAQKKDISSEAAADAALLSLQRRLDRFVEEGTGYVSWVAPQYMTQRGGDYDQLARLYEWHVLGDEDATPETEDKNG